MINDYVSKNKHAVFPHITDWTASPDSHIKGRTVRELGYWEWFWLHPSAYWMLSFTINGTPLIIFIVGMVYTYDRYGAGLLPLICLVLSGIQVMALVRLTNRLLSTPEFTFYDLYMRENMPREPSTNQTTEPSPDVENRLLL